MFTILFNQIANFLVALVCVCAFDMRTVHESPVGDIVVFDRVGNIHFYGTHERIGWVLQEYLEARDDVL